VDQHFRGRLASENVPGSQGELAFGCDTAEPAAVRRWLEDDLRSSLAARADLGDLISDALTIATELVTNAIRAGCDRGRISWMLEPGCLQLAVYDNAPGWPVMRNPRPTDTHGRGLRIIEALAADRGTRAVDGGKQAWAALELPD
jgi:two-component sensor histidine kinase